MIKIGLFLNYLNDTDSIKTEKGLVDFLHRRLTHGHAFSSYNDNYGFIRSSYKAMYSIAESLREYVNYIPENKKGNFSAEFFDLCRLLRQVSLEDLCKFPDNTLKMFLNKLTNRDTVSHVSGREVGELILNLVHDRPLGIKDSETVPMNRFQNVNVGRDDKKVIVNSYKNVESFLLDVLEDEKNLSQGDRLHLESTLSILEGLRKRIQQDNQS